MRSARSLALFSALALIAIPALHAATLSVTVRDARGAIPRDAVIFAVPEGRRAPLAKRTAVMDQKNRMFVPHVLPVQVGTAVSFPNSDDIHHQVYSFSSAKTFQLPLYKGTPARAVLFNRAGVVPLGCNIHDRMSAFIVVVDTPYFAVAGGDGRVDLTGLPEGRYGVHVWTAAGGDEPQVTPLSIASDDRKELSVVVSRK